MVESRPRVVRVEREFEGAALRLGGVTRGASVVAAGGWGRGRVNRETALSLGLPYSLWLPALSFGQPLSRTSPSVALSPSRLAASSPLGWMRVGRSFRVAGGACSRSSRRTLGGRSVVSVFRPTTSVIVQTPTDDSKRPRDPNQSERSSRGAGWKGPTGLAACGVGRVPRRGEEGVSCRVFTARMLTRLAHAAGPVGPTCLTFLMDASRCSRNRPWCPARSARHAAGGLGGAFCSRRSRNHVLDDGLERVALDRGRKKAVRPGLSRGQLHRFAGHGEHDHGCPVSRQPVDHAQGGLSRRGHLHDHRPRMGDEHSLDGGEAPAVNKLPAVFQDRSGDSRLDLVLVAEHDDLV